MTDYALVNGLQLYYEVHGEGDPLVLLHGGVAGIAMMRPILPALSEARQVIPVDLQGHGQTPDVDRPLRFETMADDIGALLEHLGLRRADVMGYSLGGGVALQLATRHPASVRKLVVMSAPARRDGWYPEVRAGFDEFSPALADTMKQSPLAEVYPDLDWARLFAKLGDLLRRDYDWSKEVAVIEAPTMLVFADADAIRAEHIAELFGLFGGWQRDAGLDGSLRPRGQLAILPGRTHYDVIAAPALAPAVTAFLDAPMPA